MLWKRFLPRDEFDSYEDLKKNYKVNVPDDFNFTYDVVDEWARIEPGKTALVYCNDNGEEKIFTFNDIGELSAKTANWLKSLGIKKGDAVMLMLRRRYEYWIIACALHRIGAILIPTSIQMSAKTSHIDAKLQKLR